MYQQRIAASEKIKCLWNSEQSQCSSIGIKWSTFQKQWASIRFDQRTKQVVYGKIKARVFGQQNKIHRNNGLELRKRNQEDFNS